MQAFKLVLRKEKEGGKFDNRKKKGPLAELNTLLLTAVGLQSGALTIELLELDCTTCPNSWLYRWSQISVNTKWLASSCSKHIGQSECRHACMSVLGHIGMWICREHGMLLCKNEW